MNHIRLISPVDGSLYAERAIIGSHALEQVLRQAQARAGNEAKRQCGGVAHGWFLPLYVARFRDLAYP